MKADKKEKEPVPEPAADGTPGLSLVSMEEEKEEEDNPES